MSIFQAVILGVIQGITEFLPVSSSGHLVLFQKIFGITEPALLFDTLVHCGTLLAVVVVLWRDILNILTRLFQPLTLHLIIATIPAVIIALLFKGSIESAFSSGDFLGFAFLITSALLWVSEFISRRPGKGGLPRNQDEMTWRDALAVGALQAAAVMPGVSRSGATLSGALSRRLDRDFAARFSFLLSVPAILGALVLQIKDLAGNSPLEASPGNGPIPLAAGALSAALVGFFSIRIMLKIVREKSLLGFAVYT
ncbi:MAG: undecaprenyl-diphosphate phosphatase, partial [Treponema sp.]|nr:undecaprenyl-diphosphate phosphatase [Treponema sp.]